MGAGSFGGQRASRVQAGNESSLQSLPTPRKPRSWHKSTTRKATKLYINGGYVEAKSGKSFSLQNPKDNKQFVSAVPIAGPEDVDLPVEVAEKAFHGEWSQFTAIQRTESARQTSKQAGDCFPDDDGFAKIVTQEPLGVCAAINPFNAPVPTMFLKVLPVLVTGNVIIVKPSEKTPLGTLAHPRRRTTL
ncbi:uncharacterized protein MYCGRDRAFT_95690 [Zymoseptoria tritici IPO323]|uniref:aldehyde dehydrogenase (NAD(+)) n=1 Tax=Zymoseptoria tritici (strain CBS 115943 / IPO323) TaxID=336722 RepID=F9XJY7_ZYMTI|nr:uncharacterized protein MYCGRDRAFT_95690 [Zymoseptoria tritici IPO323]EGP84351.1 hypothetical protein MYCGRDRAFT_95690 [Zymoseptoria tritici IPO323]